ncbi:MAG: MFS transporter [Gammaproteobacteria bacterium]|nr:MFS transporter [Gammaproteobacteria bacterium]
MTSLRSLPLGMFAILWLIGWTLRVPILAAPPLATRIADSYGLGEAGIGALTMLPIVAVAFGALPAAWLIAKFSLRSAIVGGIVVMAFASIARGYAPSSMLLFTISLLMGLGVALFQTALPAAVRSWTPSHIATGSAVYLNGMMVGEFSGAGLTLPIVLPLADGDWRTALVIWSFPILIIALIAFLAKSEEVGLQEEEGTTDSRTGAWASLPRWNDGQVWQFGLLLACSIVIFFTINAYVGAILRSRGEEYALTGLLIAFNSTPLLASFVVLSAPRWIGRRNPLGASAIIATLGLAGFYLLNGWASWLSAVIAGLTSTIELILLVSLPASIAKGLGVIRLSAGTTLIGYAVAFILPLVGGWIAELTSQTEMALIPALVFSILMIPVLGRERQYVCKSMESSARPAANSDS